MRSSNIALAEARPASALTKNQVRAFWAAWGGWTLDGMDSFIYALVLVPALTELLPRSGIAATPANGTFFIATDQWHHLEGTFVQPGVFRVYFYDDLSRPLRVDGFTAAVAKGDDNARETGTAVPLTIAQNPDGNVIDAAIADAKLPLNLKLHVRFKAEDKDQAFDFTFSAYSKEP